MTTTASIVTVGDELLTGDVENTNATWIAARLTDRGVDVRQIRVVPDDHEEIAAAVAELGERSTYLLTTGGLGSTPDDLTCPAVADALGRPLEPHPEIRRLVEAAVAEIHEEHPEFRHDVAAASLAPADVTPIHNEAGIVPGWVCGNVYVLPGIPVEMKAVFERIEAEFSGGIQSRVLYSDTPESHLAPILEEARERFGVRVGCYPSEDRKRIRLASGDGSPLDDAYDWLTAHPEVQAIVPNESHSE